MSTILSIATSGMVAATQQAQVSANNVANAESDGPLPWADAAIQAQIPAGQISPGQIPAAQYPAAYTPEQANQVATQGGATKVVVTSEQPGTTPAYDPAAPYADRNGLVATPNVDLAKEMVQQATASYAFAINAKVARVYLRTTKSLLNIET